MPPSDLVDLVEHHDTVARARFADGLNDVAGQGADIGAAMAANFCLVVHAAKTDPHEFALHGARDGLAQRGLADARRADQTEDRCLALRCKLAHRKILDDPAFDLLEAIVVLVENAPRLGDVDRRPAPASSMAARSASRDSCAPCRVRLMLPASAPVGATPCAPAPPPLSACSPWRWPLTVRRSPRLALLTLTELALNGRQLLAQQHLALALVNGRLGLPADLLREP